VHNVKETATQARFPLQFQEKRYQLHEYRSNSTLRVAISALADRTKLVPELERSANRGLGRGLAEHLRWLEM